MVLSLLHSPNLTFIHDHWKNYSLDRWTFVGKVMSLLFNMLSRLVVAFPPRSKCLFFSPFIYLLYNIVLVLPYTDKRLLISWEVYLSVGDSQHTMYKGSENSCTEDAYFFNPGFNKLIWAQDTLSIKTSYRISLKRYQF